MRVRFSISYFLFYLETSWLQFMTNLATVSSFLFFASSQLDLKDKGGVVKIQRELIISSIPREDHVGDHGDEVVEEGDDQANDR